MEGKISTILANSGQKLIHSIQVKLRVGPVKSERIAVFSNTYFSIFQKNECKKSFLWIELSSINATDKDVTLKFGKNVFRIFPSDLKQFLSCIFDVIQRVLLPSELEKLNFEMFHSFVALPNPFSCSSRIRMKIEESKIEYDRSLVQSITDMLSYRRKELDLSMFDSALIPLIMDAIPLYYGIRSIKISSSGKIDAYHYVSELALEKTSLRLIDVQGYSNSNFDNYIANLSLNKSPKLLSLSFESSFFQAPQLNSIKNLYKKSSLKGIEFHDAIAPQAFDFFHDSFFLSLNLKSLNLDRTRGLNLPRIFILVPDLVLLSLEGCDLDISDVIIQIQKLTKLRSINLSGNRCTNSAKLRTPLPDNILSVYVNNVTWEKQCLVEFFKYRVMKLSISYISTTTDEWQRLFDSLPENQNNTLASIIWDGNNLHSNFFNYLKNQICMNYISLNDCFSQSHPECLSYLIDYLRYKDLALTEISLRGTETNHIGEYLPNILNIIFNSTKINTIDVYGQRGGDQSLLTIKENMGSVKVISCDKMNPTKGGLLFDLADKATSYQVWLSYPSDDILSLVHSNRLSASESRTLYNKFRMLPKRIKKQPPRILYPPPATSAFDFPFQVYKYIPQNDFPRYLKEKQLRLYEKAPPMSKVAPSITLPNGQKQVVMSPQSSPQQQQPQVSFQSPQSTPRQQIEQTKTIFIQQDVQMQNNIVDNADPTLTLGSPSNNQINQGFSTSFNKVNQVTQQYAYNRQSPSNSNQNQQINTSTKVFQNYSGGSPPSSKNRSKTGSSSPTSIYKEMSRPPPPRFIFEDDPITLEMSRDDETILPTIDEEFYPYNNNDNGMSKTANNYYYNNYNNNNYDNNFSKTTNQRQIQASNQAPSRNRSRTNPSRNERATSRNQKKNQMPEEEDFDDDRYDDDNNNVKRNTRRRHYEDDDLDNENMRRQTKSRSRGRNEVHRSTSRQHQNHRHRNNNDDEYDDDNEYFERQPEYDDEFEENDEEIENNRRRSRNTSRNRRKNSPRNVPLTERPKRERHRLNYEDEFENENYDYDDDENEFKNQSRRRRTTAAPAKSRTQRSTQQASKTPSPYSRSKQSSSHRPNQRQSQQIQHQQQKQQPQSQRQHRRNEASRQRQRVSSRNANYNYNDDGEDYDENEYNDNNYSDDNFVERKPKVQSQRRSRNVQQQRPKQQRKSQSHRPRVQKLQNNDYDDYNNDYDDDQDDNENDDFNRQSRSRQHRRQIQNQVQQARKHIQHRTPAAPERIHETQRRQKTERNNVISNRQQVHSKSRSRTNRQRMNNYNKDFDENNNGYEDDDYDNDFENNDDDSQSYSVKRKEYSQKNPSRNHSRKQYSENAHSHKIVHNINHDVSPKPSRRPAPKYVKDLSFSSAYSYE